MSGLADFAGRGNHAPPDRENLASVRGSDQGGKFARTAVEAHAATAVGRSRSVGLLRAPTNTVPPAARAAKLGEEESEVDQTITRVAENDSNLTVVNLSWKRIGDEWAKKLSEALGDNTVVTTVNLDINGVGDEGAGALADMLHHNATLTKLILGANRIGVKGAKAFSEVLRCNCTLRELNLGSNRIDAEAARVLAEVLPFNANLVELGLGRNNIGSKGARALAEAMRRNVSLTYLDLGENKLGADEAKMFAEMLTENNTLTGLYLGTNIIGDEGAKALANALYRNVTLAGLDLRSNRISDEGARHFAKVLAHNTTLTYLHLGGSNSVSDELSSIIMKLIGSNKNLPSAQESSSGAIRSRGREVMRHAMASGSKPLPVDLEYLKHCTNNFSDDRKRGEGSYGEVYLGTDEVLRRKFVVKRLKMNSFEFRDEGAIFRSKRSFQRELETLSRFNKHPNIARLYAYFLSDDLRDAQCLVFELAANGSLKSFLTNDDARRKLHWTARIQIAHDISRAVRYLHQGDGRRMCFHGDINPANVCLRKDYTALLIDCGLSTLEPVNDSSMTLSIMRTSGAKIRGTPGYICPDYANAIISGLSPKYRSANDVFSLGVVFMDVFTGLLQCSFKQDKQVNHFEWNNTNYAGRDLTAHADSCAKEWEEHIRKLTACADSCAGEWEEHICKDFAELAAECITKNPSDRPNICDIEDRLASLSGSAKPWTTGEKNSVAFLFSDPLIYYENGVQKPIARLDRKWEMEHLKDCIQRSEQDIKLSFHAATKARLQELARKRCGCLHISCHGVPYDRLVFEDGFSGAQFIRSSDLGSSFTHREPFKLVFVASCHSEIIGQAFVDAGVKHVICCEHESQLSNDAAADFTGAFYMDLAVGYTVQHAFESGRKAAPDAEQRKFLLLPNDEKHDAIVFSKDKLEWIEDRETRQKIVSAPSKFVGRQWEMYQLIWALLKEKKRLVTIAGENGIGKSALARAVCGYICDRLDDSLLFDDIFYVNRNSQTADETNEGGTFLRLLYKQLREDGLTDDFSQHDLSDCVCNAMAGMKVLLVFDGFDNQKESMAQFLSCFFDEVESVSILLTAKGPLEFHSVAVVEEGLVYVDRLDTVSATSLFALSCPHADKAAELSERLCNAIQGGSSHDVLETICGGIPSKIIEKAKSLTRESYSALKRVCSSFAPSQS